MITCMCWQSTLRSRDHPNRVTSACYAVLSLSVFSFDKLKILGHLGRFLEPRCQYHNFFYICPCHQDSHLQYWDNIYAAYTCSLNYSTQLAVVQPHSAVVYLLINDTKTLCLVISGVLCSCKTRGQCGKPKRMPKIK